MSRLNLFGMTAKALTQGALALVSSGLLVACGGGDSVTTATRYTVGGSVTGLVGTGLVLEDNGGDSLTVAGNGSFKFATAVPNGAAYAVTVKTQPSNPAQSCVVTSGTGTINGADISGVAVKCTTNGYTVGGTVSGLSGSGLVLQDNGGNDLPISANGAFTFAQTVGSGSNYAVTVKTPPSNPAESCSVSNATGKVGNANVTNVVVNCSNQSFAVSGTIANLVGTGLTLRNNGAPLLFTGTTFSVALPSGSSYNITVASQPTGPSQTCVASNNTGTVTGGNITNVLVTCTTNTYHIKGTISGLTGSGFVLQDNGGNNLTVAANATAFQFTTAIASGQTYSVTVQTQPNAPAQYCVVTNGSGTVVAADITNVAIGCRNEGTYAFVADSAASTISAFTIASNTGLLTYQSNAATAAANSIPTGVAAVTLPAGAGTYVYSSDFNHADVAKFSFNTTTNALAYVDNFSTGTAPATPTSEGSTPSAIAIDPTGKFLLVADSENAASATTPATPGQLLVFAIDQATGELTAATGGFATATDVAPGNSTSSVALTVNPADTPYAFAVNQFDPALGLAGFSFNNPPTSGTLTQLTPWQTATGNGPVWVTVDPLDRFVYVSNSTDGSISGYSLNLANGLLTPLNSGTAFSTGFTAGAATGAIAIDPTGRFLYVADTANTQVVAFSIDPTTGNLTAIAAYATDTVADAPFAVAVDPSGHFVYVGNTGLGTIAMFTADPNTGALTAVGGSPLNYGGTGANAITIQ